MTIGIVGLGLIGASLAKAIKENTNNKILAFDKSRPVSLQSKLEEMHSGVLTPENLGDCDLVLIAIYPRAAVNYIKENAAFFKKEAIVVDCSGTKKNVCKAAFPVAKKNGFIFIGGHPMAGTQFSGFRYSRSSLFKNAPMLLTARQDESIRVLERIKKFFIAIGFGSVIFTTPEEHDRIIAYTSQLAHVVSSAYVKSPTASEHKGFSAGSYKDLTRVARLNEEMWSELFLENSENLIYEINYFINTLNVYKKAIEENDKETLRDLLKEGRERKDRIERGKDLEPSNNN